MTINEIPLRQSDGRPSPKAQAVVARVRVNPGRRRGVETPKWIVALSKTHPLRSSYRFSNITL
jgi:hypothetical protein